MFCAHSLCAGMRVVAGAAAVEIVANILVAQTVEFRVSQANWLVVDGDDWGALLLLLLLLLFILLTVLMIGTTDFVVERGKCP